MFLHCFLRVFKVDTQPALNPHFHLDAGWMEHKIHPHQKKSIHIGLDSYDLMGGFSESSDPQGAGNNFKI